MSVLTKLIQDRETWAAQYRTSLVRRSRLVVLEYALLVAMALVVVAYYNRSLAVVTGLLKF